MKKRWLLLCVLALAAMLALCGCGGSGGEESETETASVTNDGMTMSYPAEYEDLLKIDTPQGAEDGRLFIVAEKASIEAAEADYQNEVEGPGWLFSIGKVSADEMHQMLAGEMSGTEVFAKDGDGNYYVYYHPTDVRLIREDNEAMDEAMPQWEELCKWANSVPETFVKENDGLEAVKYTNTELDMYLARLAFTDDIKYTVTRLDPEPLKPGKVKAADYILPLIDDATYEEVQEEAPDGEYVVVDIPDEDVRIDFFVSEEKPNYVRIVKNGKDETLYKATFTDDSLNVGDIATKWHDALSDNQ